MDAPIGAARRVPTVTPDARAAGLAPQATARRPGGFFSSS